MKVCGGIGMGIGASVQGGGVSNMEGSNCRSGNYSGYFLEFGGSVPGIGGGVDIGLTDTNENYIPDGFSGVNEAGLGYGMGLGGSVMLCYYIFIGEG